MPEADLHEKNDKTPASGLHFNPNTTIMEVSFFLLLHHSLPFNFFFSFSLLFLLRLP